MIKRDYYKLKKAAEILKCSEDDLIDKGAEKEIPIFMLTAKYFVKATHIDSTGRVVGTGDMDDKLARLTVKCLEELHAGKNAPAIIRPEPIPDEFGGGRFTFQLRHKSMMYPEPITQDNSMQYPDPVLIRDCELVILADDLARLQESQPGELLAKNHELGSDPKDESGANFGAGNQSTKPRKKLIPIERETTESLLLIYEITTFYKVNYQDELPGPKAWGKIVSLEFKSDLITSISDAKKSITLNGGEKLTDKNFYDKYRKRFKKSA